METSNARDATRGALRRDRRDRQAKPSRAPVRPVDPTGSDEPLHVGPLFGAPATDSVPAGEPARDGAPTILVVCTGNICRSPLAELLLRDRLAPLGVRVHSAGTRALVDVPMQPESQRIAVAHRVSAQDAAAHRARQVTEPMLRSADLTLTMTREHRTRVVEAAPSALRRSFPIREFATLAAGVPAEELQDAARAAVAASGRPTPRVRLAGAVSYVSARRGLVLLGTDADDVIDPYGQPAEVYDESAAELLPAIDEVVRVLRAVLTPVFP